jgi:hypothetical protein
MLRLCLVASVSCVSANAGYTHYYTWLQKPNDSAVRECIAEMRRIVDAHRSILAGPEAEGPPEVTPLRLAINGIGDEGHETFLFPGDVDSVPKDPRIPKGFNFCKTAAEPYDEVVTACLLAARDHFAPSVLKIESDGSWAAGDWSAGASLYSSVLGRAARNPMTDQPDDGPPIGLPPAIPTVFVICVITALVVVLRRPRRF